VGAACRICTESVTKDQLEFEIQFAFDGVAPGLDKFHLHRALFRGWEFERSHGQPHS
jgi:hypothetical protein